MERTRKADLGKNVMEEINQVLRPGWVWMEWKCQTGFRIYWAKKKRNWVEGGVRRVEGREGRWRGKTSRKAGRQGGSGQRHSTDEVNETWNSGEKNTDDGINLHYFFFSFFFLRTRQGIEGSGTRDGKVFTGFLSFFFCLTVQHYYLLQTRKGRGLKYCTPHAWIIYISWKFPRFK